MRLLQPHLLEIPGQGVTTRARVVLERGPGYVGPVRRRNGQGTRSLLELSFISGISPYIARPRSKRHGSQYENRVDPKLSSNPT